MTRRQKRKIIIIIVLLLLLLALGVYYAYFRSTKRLDFNFSTAPQDTLPAPEYLYSFSGTDAQRMLRPIGVAVIDDEVYATDSRLGKVFVFTVDGKLKRVFGGDEMKVPLYIAKNPKDGNLYVTDRRTRSIHIYKKDGAFVRDFDPKLPKDQLPTFATNGVQWAPVALAFGRDGTLYVTEILNGHRLLIFGPDGSFLKSVGTVGLVNDAKQGKELFQFPNSVKVHGDRVYVADSNNRRVQVFDLKGNFQEIIVTDGLPRGMDFLARSQDASTTDKFVVADTLAHDGTIWSIKGEKIVSFGERGVLEGQFNYPNDLSVGPKNLIFITDSANGRIQVWGWPEQITPAPIVKVIPYWRWCFSPLLLLPLLLFFRKRKFFATADFIEAMIALELVRQMPHRQRRWVVTEQVHEQFRDSTVESIQLGELLSPIEYSESDVNDLMQRLEVDHDTAVVLSIAKRSHVFCTENPEFRRLAKLLEIDVVDHEEYLERFSRKNADGGAGHGKVDHGADGETADTADRSGKSERS